MSLRSHENLIKHRFCAKYVPDQEGREYLYQVQEFGVPIFTDEGWEEYADHSFSVKKKKGAASPESKKKAVRRAQRLAFDFALCNYQLDAFFTLTYAPKDGFDRTAFGDVYRPLKVWLSNQVQRRNMSYIMVAEHHKKGGIHFHGLCNSESLKLVEAINPHTGRKIVEKGKTVYNISNWENMGFSTCKLIGSDMLDRMRVAKYVTKYITKDTEKIGGRYLFHGGALARPRKVLGDSLSEFSTCEPLRVWKTSIEGVGEYTEYSYM